MYNPTPFLSGLSLTKIIGGISKTLQVANQIIPLYYKTKPIISNAKNILNVLKKEPTEKKNSLKQVEKKEPKILTTSNTAQKKKVTSSPTFFL